MIRKTTIIILLSVFLFPALPLWGQQVSQNLIGYTKDRAEKQLLLEKNIQARVSPEQNRNILRILSTRMNVAGTPGDRKNAEYYRDYLHSLGFKTRIFSYFVYLPYPVRNRVTVHGLNPVTLEAGEKGVPEDIHSRKVKTSPFNAYSPSARVRAKVVYANYGRPEDFERLNRLGVDIKGKIVLIRYGHLFRGSKVYQAESRGAAGVILYSDPFDDGYFRGDIYPLGRMRPGDAVQRGSIYYMFSHPGDPLTPMEPAKQFAERIKPEDSGLPKIPCLPLGYDQALEIIKRLKGKGVPQGWQGALPVRYHLGGQELEVTLDVKADYKLREIWDVMGILEGSQLPDEWVMVGCHRDAWVFGTQDPHSGNSVILEAARCLAEAAKEAGGLKRSVVVCSWDAEEFGVIGSIEWVEEMRDELQEKAVAYMNADAIISGTNFGSGALPTLRPALDQILKQVKNADGISFFEGWRKSNPGQRSRLENFQFGSMGGGGSDHTGFIHHVGVPCLVTGSWDSSGVGHSSYDTMHWMEKFGDPGFKTHASVSRLMAVILSRFANADVLPLRPSEYAAELRRFFTALKEELPGKLIKHLKEFEDLFDSIEQKGKSLEEELEKALFENRLTRKQMADVDRALMALERSFISSEGLWDRPWNRNLLYSPNVENGYGMVTFPGLISTKDDENKFIIEVERFKNCLYQYLNTINRARQGLS